MDNQNTAGVDLDKQSSRDPIDQIRDLIDEGAPGVLSAIADIVLGQQPRVTEQADEKALPIELMGVRETMADGGGFWQSCSGCHDTEDGHPTGPYSYSRVFGCALGSGCSECGGIGAVWDNTDYEAMAADWDKPDDAVHQAAPEAPANLSDLILAAMYKAFQRGDSVERAHAAVMEIVGAPAAQQAGAAVEMMTLLRDAARAWNNEAESQLDATMERIECFLIDSRASRASNAGEDTERDAARYRFLRHADLDSVAATYWPNGDVPEGEEFDRCIDAAIATSTKEKK